MSGRLDDDLLDRFIDHTVRVFHVVAQLENDHRRRRVSDQLTGCGSSPGAQMFEANEAMSRADFIKSLGWAAKELSETRYWLKVISKMQWIADCRLEPLAKETQELLNIVKAMKVRSKRRAPIKTSRTAPNA